MQRMTPRILSEMQERELSSNVLQFLSSEVLYYLQVVLRKVVHRVVVSHSWLVKRLYRKRGTHILKVRFISERRFVLVERKRSSQSGFTKLTFFVFFEEKIIRNVFTR